MKSHVRSPFLSRMLLVFTRMNVIPELYFVGLTGLLLCVLTGFCLCVLTGFWFGVAFGDVPVPLGGFGGSPRGQAEVVALANAGRHQNLSESRAQSQALLLL